MRYSDNNFDFFGYLLKIRETKGYFMAISFINDIKAYDPRILLDYPYRLGSAMIQEAVTGERVCNIAGRAFSEYQGNKEKLSLSDRIVSFLSSIAFMIPIVNIINTLALKLIFNIKSHFSGHISKDVTTFTAEVEVPIVLPEVIESVPEQVIIEYKSINEFVANFNDLPTEGSSRYFIVANDVLDGIEEEISSEDLVDISDLRKRLLKMSECNSYDIEVRSLKLLLQVLENDPMNGKSAFGLLEIIDGIADKLEKEHFFGYESKHLQRLLLKTFEGSLDCLLLHISSAHFDRLDDIIRIRYLETIKSLREVELEDFQIKFSLEYAAKALSFLEVKKTGFLSILDNCESIFRVGKLVVKIAVAFSGAGNPVNAIKESVEDVRELFGDLQNLFNDMDEKTEDFEKLLVLKKMCYFSQHDTGLFSQTIALIQKYKNAEEDSFFFEGVVSILESVALSSSKRDVQEDVMKFIIQYSLSSQENVKSRVVAAFVDMYNEKGIIGKTAYVILKAFEAVGIITGNGEDETTEILARIPALELPEVTGSGSNYHESNKYICFSVIKLFIRWLAEIKDEKDLGGYSLISQLSLSREPSVMKGLLKWMSTIFPNYNKPDVYGYTPYLIAIKNNNLPMVKCISEVLDIDIDAQEYEKGYSILHMVVDLYGEYPEEALEIAKFVFEADALKGLDRDLRDREGNTALHIAVEEGYIDLIELFLKNEASHDICNNSGQKPLDVSIKQKKSSAAVILLKRGAEIASEKYGITPIILAASLHAESILMNILSYRKASQGVEGAGSGPIVSKTEALYILQMMGCFDGRLMCSPEFARYHLSELSLESEYSKAFDFYKYALIEGAGEVYSVRIKDDSVMGASESFMSFANQEPELDLDQVNICETDYYGLTPLHLAVMTGNLVAMDNFISRGADVDAVTLDGFTPAHMAAMWHNKEALRKLHASGADLDIDNNYGDTSLALFCGNITNRVAFFKKILNIAYKKIDVFSVNYSKVDFDGFFEIFTSAEVLFTVTDKANNNILHHAARYGSRELLKVLMSSKTFRKELFWEKNDQGLIPLQASYRGQQKSKSLIEMMLSLQNKHEEGWLAFSRHFSGFFRESNIESKFQTDFGTSLLGFMARMDLGRLFTELYSAQLSNPDFMRLHDESVYQLHPLHMAILSDSTEVVDAYVRNGWPLDCRDSFGNTPLILSLLERKSDIFDSLMSSQNISIEQSNYDSRTALHIAALKGLSREVELLVEKGGNTIAKDVYGNTPFHMSCIYGRLNVVKLLLQKNPDVLTISNDEQLSPLQSSCIRGHFEVPRYLIEQSDEEHIPRIDFDTADIFGRTAIMLAAQGGYMNLCRLLIKVSNLESIDRSGENILHKAIFNRHPEIVELITNAARVSVDTNLSRIIDQTDSDGETPLHELAKLGDYRWKEAKEILIFLRSVGVNLNIKDGNGDDFRHKLFSYGCTELLKWDFKRHRLAGLVNHHLFPWLDRVDKRGNSYLNIAANRGSLSLCKWLVSDLRVNRLKKNNNGETALLIAAEKSHWKIVELLLEPRDAFSGASKHSRRSQRDKKGRNIAHIIASKKHLDIGAINSLKVIFKDLEKRCLFYVADNDGKTALHYLASNSGSLEALELVLSGYPRDDNNGALAINLFEDNGQANPIVLAIDNGHPEFANRLRMFCREGVVLEEVV